MGRILSDANVREKHTNCILCGAELTKWQRKYCTECGNAVSKSKSAERHRRVAEEEARTGIKRPHIKTEANSCEHLEWEADICLNCKRPSCNNCLHGLSLEEKEELLEKSGGKKWLD